MIGETGLFMDHRLAFWLSAVYFNRQLLRGEPEEEAIIDSRSVFAAVEDEMDFVESERAFQYN